MEYSNPKIPEEINYSKENSLKEFIYLVFGIFAVIAIFVAGVYLLAQNFAHHIPFEYEKKIFSDSFNIGFEKANPDNEQEQKALQVKQAYLTNLGNKLASHMNLPDNMQIHINYINTDTINAAATLNGHIFIYQGLLDYVESENELAMVIAHEIAHIKARHPIKALSSGVIVGIVMSIISGSIDNGGAASVLSSSTMLTSLNFSRKQEMEADELALQALYAYYGHTKGSYDFFARLHKKEKLNRYLEFISTHPGSDKRVDTLKTLERNFENNDMETAKLIRLPDGIQSNNR